MRPEDEDTLSNIPPIQDDIPTTVRPLPPPPPALVTPTPVEAEKHQNIDLAHSRGRAGVAALAFGLLLLGGLGGYLFGASATAREFQDIPPVVETSTSTESTTATATATETETRTRTQTVTPPPKTATATVTATETRTQPGSTRTVEVERTPTSCLLAMDAADTYVTLAKEFRKGKETRDALRRAERAYERFNRQCRGQQ